MKKFCVLSFIVVISVLVCLSPVFAQDRKVDLNALAQETQKMSQDIDQVRMIWWIPEEFWKINFAQTPTVTDAQAEEFLKVLRPYTVVVGVDGTMGSFGGVTYKSESAIRKDIQIIDKDKNPYRALDEEQINPDTKNLLAMMKPVFINMLGPLGQNMHFFLFPAKNKKGQLIADAKTEGSFSVLLGGREYKWRLPLGSLLPPRTCPKCGEELNGAYKYCPWDGTKL